jgi:RNA polymerase sigma factor (sigma-70 family)
MVKPPKSENWQQLVEKNLKLAYWCAKPYKAKVRCRADYDALVSDALTELVWAGRCYDPHYCQKDGKTIKFSTYAVFRIVRKLVTSFKASAGLTVPISEAEEELAYTDPKPVWIDAEEPDGAKEVRRLLRKTSLPKPLEWAVVEHFLKGKSQYAIGRELGVSGQCIQDRIRRALVRLRKVAEGCEVEELTCPECGVEFEKKGPNNRYCSPKCQNAGRVRRQAEGRKQSRVYY